MGTSNFLINSKDNVYKTQLLSHFPKVQDKQHVPNANQGGIRVHEMKPRVRHKQLSKRTNLLAQRHPKCPILSVDNISLWGDVRRGCTSKQKPILRVLGEGVWFLKCQFSRNLIGILGSHSRATSFPSCGEVAFCSLKISTSPFWSSLHLSDLIRIPGPVVQNFPGMLP